MEKHSTTLEGSDHELKFWTKFVHSDHFKTWLAPGVSPEMIEGQSEVVRLLTGLPQGTRVLDVGSGVVSILTGMDNLQVTAVDPLGEEYERIFDYRAHNLRPPISLQAEELGYKNEFDVVHMRNALDHSQDPVRALLKLIDACAIGGYVIIHGFENEADDQGRSGFHQTNISLSGIDLSLNGKSYSFPNIDTVTATTHVLKTGKRWVTWIGKKK